MTSKTSKEPNIELYFSTPVLFYFNLIFYQKSTTTLLLSFAVYYLASEKYRRIYFSQASAYVSHEICSTFPLFV